MSRAQDDEFESEWAADDEDRDLPQERDLVEQDDDETATVPCPHCRAEIPDFADRCPYCGEWVVQSSGARRNPPAWMWLVVGMLIAGLLLWALF